MEYNPGIAVGRPSQAFAAVSSDMVDGWKLRLRGLRGQGAPDTLEVPLGGDTTLQDLVRLAAKASGIAQKRCVIKFGFPPKRIQELTLAQRKEKTIREAGIQNREVLVIERGDPQAPDPGREGETNTSVAASTSAAKATPTPSSPTKVPSAGAPGKTKVRITKSGDVRVREVRKRKKRVRMPGTGRALGGPDDAMAAETNDDFVIGRPRDPMESAAARIGADLVSAARGSNSQDTLKSSALKSLRKTFREARTQHGAYVEAEEKVAACMAGRTRFEPLADNSGRLRACYTKPGGRKEREECVTDIPCFLLKAILKQIATEGDEEQVQNLRPVSMALVSPRVFWSLVRHGGVGPGVSFAAALGNLVPSVDWNALVEQRKRARPEKYGDYVSH